MSQVPAANLESGNAEAHRLRDEFGVKAFIECKQIMARFVLLTLGAAIFGLLEGFRFGFLRGDYLRLILGFLVSIVSVFAYGVISIGRASGVKPKPVWMWSALSPIVIPYAFTLYLIFYRGFGFAVMLFHGFSGSRLASSTFFVFTGWMAFKQVKKLNALGQVSKLIEKREEASANETHAPTPVSPELVGPSQNITGTFASGRAGDGPPRREDDRP